MTMLPQPIAASLTVLCIWLGLGTIDGKCAGKWAIHACGAGNGKRSDLGAVFQGSYPARLPSNQDTAAPAAAAGISLKQVLLSLQQQHKASPPNALLPAAAAAPEADQPDGYYGGESAAAASRSTVSVQLPRGYLPVEEMVDAYQREAMDDLRRQHDDQQLRSFWDKLVTSLKSRGVGRR